MKCIILAAGYATRLYPLTENFPKPLLKVKGKTILDRLIEDINLSGEIEHYVIVSNSKYKAHFDEWAKPQPYNITVVDDGTVSNDARLGAVRDIQFAVDHLKLNDEILVIAGDNLLDFSLCKFISYAQENQTSCVMRYHEKNIEKLKKCGVICIDENDRIISMEEKPITPKSHWIVPPFYYFTKSDAQKIPAAISEGCATDAPGSYIAWLCKKSPVYAMEMQGNRYDIGNLESYQKICLEYPE